MTPPDVSENYAKLLRRGRITLLLITLMVGLAESVVVLTTLARRGSQSVWQLALGVVLSLLLLRAVYRGHDLARWLLALLMGLLFVRLLVIAERDSLMGTGTRLLAGFAGGVCGGLAIVLITSKPIREYTGRAMLRRLYAERVFDEDGIRRYEGKRMEEWIPLAASADAGVRLEAVKGLRRVLEEIESAECERALLRLAQDREEPVRYEAVSALHFGKNLIRLERQQAIDVLRQIHSRPLPEGVALFITVEDPYTIEEYFDHDPARLEAAARHYHIFQYSGEALRNLGVDPGAAPGAAE